MNKEVWKKNKKYDHVYVVLRYDSYISDPKQAVTVTKVFNNLEKAEAEVQRLNSLSKDSSYDNYYFQIGRMPRDDNVRKTPPQTT